MVSSSSPLILNQLKFYKICIFAIIPPLCGIIAVISVAIWLHSSLIFGYKWSCGVCHIIFINFNFQTAYLPSISRLLNLPVERIIWNFVICLHLPLRFIINLHYYYAMKFNSKEAGIHKKIARRASVTFQQCQANIKSSWIPSSLSAEHYLQFIFLTSGFADQIFLLSLSVVGERESAELHVIFFSAFLISTFIHFTTHFYLDNATDCVGNGRKVRVILLALLWLYIPFIVICFSLHELYCTRFSYELFVLGEYLTIATIFALNSAILLDKHSNCVFLTIVFSEK